MKPTSMVQRFPVHRFTWHGLTERQFHRCTRFTRVAEFENAARRQHVTQTRAEPRGGGAPAARPNDNNLNRVHNNDRLKLNLERHPPLHGRFVPPAKRNTAVGRKL